MAVSTERGEVTLRNMQKILDFVKGFHKEKRYAPTLKEIAVGIGRREQDAGNIQPLVQALIQQGFLMNAGKNQGRSITPAKKPPRRDFYKF